MRARPPRPRHIVTSRRQTVAPEDLLDDRSARPVRLKLRCDACGRAFKRSFAWVAVSPDPGLADDWDGVVPSEIVECPGCGAVDEYTVPPSSTTGLLLKTLGSKGGSRSRKGVIVAASRLWDGTIVQRPTQALQRLRELTRELADSAEAFLRLGNGYKRWGLTDEAIWAWKKACELDEGEVEAAYALARHLLGPGGDPTEGFQYLRLAVARLPSAVQDERVPEGVVGGIIGLVEDVAEAAAEPFGLMAAWAAPGPGGWGQMTISLVDLTKVERFDRLFELVLGGHFQALELTPDLPDEEPTLLQGLLGEGRGTPPPHRAPARVGRNDPCPCASGKKHKRCCGRGR